MLKSENLSGLASYPTARTNLGLGTTDTPTFKNLVISTGSITTSAPVTISQTWNGTGSTVFKALVVDATTPGTTSSSSSLLLDLQVGGVSQFRVNKAGTVNMTNLAPSGFLSFQNDSGLIYFGAAGDVVIHRDAAATLALRNSTAAQTFNVYGTYSTSPSLAYSRLAIACDTSGNATLTTQSTGTAGTVSINGVPVGRGKTNEVNSVAVGTGTLTSVTSGAYNAALGLNALQVDTSGGFNSAFGVAALGSNTTANGNTALGYGALYSNTTGENNIAVGSGAGSLLANGVTSNVNSGTSVFLGVNTKALGASQTNQIVIGYDATGLGSNTAVLGNASITTTALRGNVGIGTTAPSSKLQVTGGDVEIETVTSGIIMKAAGTSTRYRITLNATGDALVFTAV
jgi:hypothetical protein